MKSTTKMNDYKFIISFLIYFSIYSCVSPAPIKNFVAAGKLISIDGCNSISGKSSLIIDIDPSTVYSPKGQTLSFTSATIRGIHYSNLVRIFTPFNAKDSTQVLQFAEMKAVVPNCITSSPSGISSFETDTYSIKYK